MQQARSRKTWTYVDGDWYEGNVAILGPRSHAMWLGTSVFDGARWFEGVAPDLDLHSKRVNASAIALGLKPTMTVAEIVGLTWDGLKKFDGKTAVYIRPMYWAEHGGYMGVPAEPSSTRFCLCLYELPMIALDAGSPSPYRRSGGRRWRPCRPTPRPDVSIPTTAGRSSKPRCAVSTMRWCSICWAMWPRPATSNIFLAHDGQVVTPVANGTFLSGITRARTIALLAGQGIDVVERTVSVRDFLEADEVFSTGNHSKVVPVTRVEERNLQPGPIAKKARELYWEFAHSVSS